MVGVGRADGYARMSTLGGGRGGGRCLNTEPFDTDQPLPTPAHEELTETVPRSSDSNASGLIELPALHPTPPQPSAISTRASNASAGTELKTWTGCLVIGPHAVRWLAPLFHSHAPIQQQPERTCLHLYLRTLVWQTLARHAQANPTSTHYHDTAWAVPWLQP